MRRWLRDPVAQTAETAQTPPRQADREVSALPAVSATPQLVELEPARWLERLRAGDLPGLPAERWNRAADALAALMESGTVAKAINLAWDSKELVGVHRAPPHDAPHRAGLIFSLWPGDDVTDVRRSGCLITYQGGRHIWLRRPLTLDTCLPWDLPA